MKEFQDIHYHVILVESMTRSRNAEQAVKELVDDLVETAHIQGRRANEVPLFTIVDYYSNYYELRCEDATEEEARAVPKMVFEEKIEEYYDCASGLSILIAFMEQMENRVGRKGRVSFHVINNGYNSLGVINPTRLASRISELEACGWHFDYYQIDRAAGTVTARSSWHFMLQADLWAMASLFTRDMSSQTAVTPSAEAEAAPEPSMLRVHKGNPRKPFTLRGVTYKGLADLEKCASESGGYETLTDFPYFAFFVNHRGQGILSYVRRYPCFDSDDYAYERRFHYNYWLCADKEDAKRKMAYIQKNLRCCNDDYSECDMPDWLGPAVFYDSGTDIFHIGGEDNPD